MSISNQRPAQWVHPGANDSRQRWPAQRLIDAKHLQLALVARKARPGTRWAAMSNGAQTAPCRQRQGGGGYYIHQQPLLTPMMQGQMLSLLDRASTQGRSEVLRTWRTSIAVLKVEFGSCILHTGASS